MSYDKSHHLEWIEIENFKCFDKLRVEGLERVNLIGGDNNVGKTAFMEACYLLTKPKLKKDILKIMAFLDLSRNYMDYTYKGQEVEFNPLFYFNNKDKILKVSFKSKFFTITYKNENLLDYFSFKFNDKEKSIDTSIKEFNEIVYEKTEHELIEFISNNYLNISLIKAFSEIQINDKEEELNSFINKFDNNLDKFKIINNTPHCYNNIQKNYLSLSSSGDGLKRFISIICAIWASKDGALFIDEIENGIHYTKLPKLWEIIFKTSKEANCQVFATTHSKETIEAFNKMQFELNEENTAYFEFMRSAKSGKIGVSKRDKERLEYSLTHGGRFRGE